MFLQRLVTRHGPGNGRLVGLRAFTIISMSKSSRRAPCTEIVSCAKAAERCHEVTLFVTAAL